MITKDKFCKIMNHFREQDAMAQNLNQIFHNYNCIDFRDGAMFIDLESQDIIIDLLIEMFEDSECAISYWCYELEYGIGYYHGCVTDEKGSPIDISTPEKLYDYVVAKMKA